MWGKKQKAKNKQSQDQTSAHTATVIYEINYKVNVDVVEEFDIWMHEHSQRMLGLPGFISSATTIPDVTDADFKHRCVQYRLSDQVAFDTYKEQYQEKMMNDGQEKFSDQYTSERRVLSIAEAKLADQSTCANCNAELEGRFCSVCGQREEPRVPTMMSISREFTNAMFGLESKLWRSLYLLVFKPGQLTKAYLSGKRQQFTSPLRMYLLLSVMAFALLIFSVNVDDVTVNDNSSEQRQTQSEVSENTEQDLKENSSTKVNSQNDENDSITENTIVEVDSSDIDDMEINIAPGFLAEETEAALKARVKSALKQIRKDGEAGKAKQIIQRFIRPIPTALLVLLPFLALVFKIVFLGSGKYYMEHLIYLLHNHSFIYLGFIAIAILGFLANHLQDSAFGFFGSILMILTIFLFFYTPYYMYRSMRVVYEGSRWIAVLRYLVLFVVYLVLFFITILISIMITGINY